jgi:acyl-CoA thioester hydrolase
MGSAKNIDTPELATTYQGTVYPWHCDHMGHMNVMWYVSKFDEANWQLFATLGMTPAYIRENERGMAAVEQQLYYKRELLAGDLVTIRSGILEMREKVMHFVHEMRNEGTNQIAAVTVFTVVHLDRRIRKACPFPKEILERGQKMIVKYDLQTKG